MRQIVKGVNMRSGASRGTGAWAKFPHTPPNNLVFYCSNPLNSYSDSENEYPPAFR